MSITVVDAPGASRFEIAVDGTLALFAGHRPPGRERLGLGDQR